MARPRPSLGLRLAARLSRPWRAARLADPSRGYRRATARPFLPIAGAAGPALVQSAVVDYKSTTLTTSYAVPVAKATSAGHHLSLQVVCYGGGGVVTGVTDSQGNTWQVDAAGNGGVATGLSIASAYLATALSTTDTITVTVGTAPTTAFLAYGIEISGLATSAWLDQAPAIASGASTTPTTPTTGTTAQASEFVLACTRAANQTAYTLNTAGFTELTPATATQLAVAYEVASATGTFAATWTVGTSVTWAAGVVTYKAAASATPEAVTGAPTGVGVDTGTPILGESGAPTGVGEVASPDVGAGAGGAPTGVGEVSGVPSLGGGTPETATGTPIGVGEVAGTAGAGAGGAPTGVGEVAAASEGIGESGAPVGVGEVAGTPAGAGPVGATGAPVGVGKATGTPGVGGSVGVAATGAPIGVGEVAASPALAGVAPTIVQHVLAAASAAGTTAQASFPVPTAPGNLLVAVLTGDVIAPWSVTPPAGWVLAATGSSGQASTTEIWYLADAPSASTVAFTVANSYWSLELIEIAGALTGSPLDQVAGAGGASSPASTGTTAATTTPEEIVIAGLGNNGAGAWGALTNGFVLLDSVAGGATTEGLLVGYLQANAEGTFGTTATSPTPVSGAIATFKAAVPVAPAAGGPVGVGEVTGGGGALGAGPRPLQATAVGVGEVTGAPGAPGPVAVPAGGPVGVGEVTGLAVVRRPLVRRRSLPPVRFEIDGRAVDVAAWTANCKANFGHDQFRGQIPERQARRRPTAITEGAVVTGWTDDSTEPVWQGEVTLAPQIVAGRASLVAQGFAHRATTRNDEVDFGVQADGAAIAGVLGDMYLVSNSEIDIWLNGTAGAGVTDTETATWASLGWQPTAIQLAATVVSGTVDANMTLALDVQDGAGNWSTPWSVPATSLPIAQQWIAIPAGYHQAVRLRWQVANEASTWGPFKVAITAIALAGQTPSGTHYTDLVTLPQVLHELALTLGWDDSLVAATINALTYSNLSWSQAFDQLASYVAAHDGGRWLLLEDRGRGPALEYAPWGGFDGSRNWRVRGIEPNLAPVARNSGVAVSFQAYGIPGTQQAIADASPPALPYTSRLAVSLSGAQTDGGALAAAIASALLPRAIAQTYSGQVKVQLASDVDGPGNPYHIRPDLVTIEDWDMGVALTQEITDVAYTPDGVTLGVNSPATAQQLLAQLLP